jgi:septum site-determining protein MinD
MLAVVGGKGGVGKTTTTLGMALALGFAGERVVAVDADRDMPDLARLAGRAAGPARSADAPRTAGSPTDRQSSVEDASVECSFESLGVAHPACSLVRIVSPDREAEARSTARASLDRLARRSTAADHVLVDCPAGAGSDAIRPIRLAGRALVVSTVRPAALADAAKTAATVEALGASLEGVALTGCRVAPVGVGRLFDGAPVDPIRPLGGEPPPTALAAACRRLADRFTERKC